MIGDDDSAAQPNRAGWNRFEVEFVAPNEPGPADTRPAHRPGSPRGFSSPVAVLALVATLVAMLLSSLWWQQRTRVVVATRTITPPVTATVDASGCPVGITCGISPDADLALLDAYSTVFSDADLLLTGTVFEAATGKSFRTELVIRTPASVVISIFAQCIPRGSAVAMSRSPIPSAGPADVVLVTPGPKGCGLTVEVLAPPGAEIPVGTILRVADDPGAQLHQ